MSESNLDSDRKKQKPSASWPPERDALLAKLWNDGLTGTQIAKQLGRGATRSSVMGRISRLPGDMKLRPPREPPPLPIEPIPKKTAAFKTPDGWREGWAPKGSMAVVGSIVGKPPARTVPQATISNAAPPLAPDAPRGAAQAHLALSNNTCRWPLGDPRADYFRFCCGPADLIGGRPYCDAHERLACGRG